MAWCKSRSEHSKRRFERMSEEEKNIEHKRRSKHYKNNSQINIKQVKERKEKIENIIDKLQIAILEKVGSYGKNLEGIKKEMSMMQDSFSKMVTCFPALARS